MSLNLKRNQIPPEQAENWELNILEEKNSTFKLIVPTILLQKVTYKLLAGENENRLKIYLGLESEKLDDRYVLCAYAVSAFLLGSGDVFRDYESPVVKLEKENVNFSSKTSKVIADINRYQQWRLGILDDSNDWSRFRQFIYPKAYLLGKYELHEIFNIHHKNEAQISFGISKTMNALIFPNVNPGREMKDQSLVFNFSEHCPPHCDETSIFNLK